MKELVLILAYTPTSEKQDRLRELIISLKSFNYRICLSTHTSTPQDIIDRCEYFLYDKENPILWDDDIKYWTNYSIPDFTLSFKSFNILATHGIALWRMYSGALSYLKSLDEEVIHMIEYDTIVNDVDFFKTNTSHLLNSTYSSVLFSLPRFYNSKGNILCNWPIQSLNIKKIPYDLLEFNFNKLETQYRDYFNNRKFPIIERMFFDNIWSQLDYKLIRLDKESDIPSLLINTDRIGDNINNIFVTINHYNDRFHYFLYNPTKNEINYTFIIDNNTINTTINPGHFKWIPISNNDIKNIRIFEENVLIKKYDLSIQEDRDSIFKYSKVIKNK
jgi:hypothetical protein